MKIDILTLFPEMFKGPFDESLMKKAQERGLVEINIHNIRHWAANKHKMVDDRPFGGGPGMVLMVEPIDLALQDLLPPTPTVPVPPPTWNEYDTSGRIILLDPAGQTFNQQKAEELSRYKHIILIAGHYKGIDERIREHLVDEEISIGDYVLTGGEIPTMVIVDAVARLIPGVVGKAESLKKESFSDFDTPGVPRLLGFPQYTRPEVYKSWKVPEILLSGNHREIEKWRIKKAKERTLKRRPDLL